jgi:hypothetical protein
VIRRPFRRGLTLGLLGAAAISVVRTVQNRRPQAEPAAPATWEPIPDTTPVTVPAPVVEVVVAPVVEAPVAEPRPKPDPAVNLLQEAPEAKAKKPAKKEAKKKAKAAPWVEPVEGACPGTHPVKGKLTSKIFHVPGGFNYPRTIPDRCYIDAAAAEADGLRASKR